MFKQTRSAVTRLAASIKSSLMLGLEKLQQKSAQRARGQMMAAILEDRLKHRTPGAFGRPISTARPCPAGIARRIQNSGKVRGF
jgi:hypothetical protein